MKITALFLLLLMLLVCTIPAASQKTERTATVYGTIKNYRNVIQIIDKDYTEPFQISNSERSFAPDSSGKFSIGFPLDEPKYFRLARNSVYLSPGDKLQADIDYEEARNSSFKGSHSQENEYLKTIPYPKAGSFVEGGQNVKSTIQETFYEMLDIAKQRRKILASYKLLSPEFRYLEQNRINADLLNSVYSLRSYFVKVHKLKGDSLKLFNTNFHFTADSFARKHVPMTVSAKLMKLEVYRDVAFRILQLKHAVGKEAETINDWFYAKEVLHELQSDTSNFDLKKINTIKTPKYRNTLLETYRKLISLNGTNAPDIVLTDKNGETVKLSSLKGKVIYIDVWATWCVPCIKEQPFLDSLKKKFSGESNIAFLSLSIDRNKSDWTNYINEHLLQGLQYITDLANLEPYYVTEIPRTILIDTDFKIYAMRGPMPSSSDVVDIIQSMLNVNK